VSTRVRAALVSALVFPGLGQLLILRRRLAGGLYLGLSATSLVAFCVALALDLHDAVAMVVNERGADLWGLFEAVVDALRHPGRKALVALLVLGGCWLLSVLDALLAPASPEGPQGKGNR